MAYLINNTSIINDSRQLLTNAGQDHGLWAPDNWTYLGANVFRTTSTWSSGTQNLSQGNSVIPATNNFSDLTILIRCTLITTGTQTFNDDVEVRFGGSEWQRAWNSNEAISTSTRIGTSSFILIQIRQFSGSYTTTGKSLISISRGITASTASDWGANLSGQSTSTLELNFDTGSGTLDEVEVKWPGSTAFNMRWTSYAWYR